MELIEMRNFQVNEVRNETKVLITLLLQIILYRIGKANVYGIVFSKLFEDDFAMIALSIFDKLTTFYASTCMLGH